MSLDLSSFGLEKDLPLPSSSYAMGTGTPRSGDWWREKLETEDVRGVRTTRYRGTIGVAEQAKQLREEGEEEGLTSYAEENGTLFRSKRGLTPRGWCGA
ncbi:MAG TPA: hypothetical protein VF245_06005 [Solirubrobacterales bacterium]